MTAGAKARASACRERAVSHGSPARKQPVPFHKLPGALNPDRCSYHLFGTESKIPMSFGRPVTPYTFSTL